MDFGKIVVSIIEKFSDLCTGDWENCISETEIIWERWHIPVWMWASHKAEDLHL